MRSDGEQKSLASKLKTAAKAAAITTAVLIPLALTAYWMLILFGVRRYDANLSAQQYNGGPGSYELIACNALSNPADFQQWQSITNFLVMLNFVCTTQSFNQTFNQTQLLAILQQACDIFKSSTPCNYAHRDVTNNIDFCNGRVNPDTGSGNMGNDLATLTCQVPSMSDSAVIYLFGPIAALATLLLLRLGCVVLYTCTKSALTGLHAMFGTADTDAHTTLIDGQQQHTAYNTATV